MRRVVLITILLVVTSSGCILPTDSRIPVGVAIENISERPIDGGVRFTGQLTVLDHYGDKFVLHDVRVVFLDNSSDILRTIPVGNIRDTSYTTQVSTNLSERPAVVRIETERIETDADVQIQGLRRNDEGDFTYFYQDT